MTEKMPAKGDVKPDFSRRKFLENAGGLAAVGSVVGLGGLSGCGALQADPNPSNVGNKDSCHIGPDGTGDRAERAMQVRIQAATIQNGEGADAHACNGDEERYANKIATFTKGLPHNALGEVDLNAFDSLIAALISGDPADFERIELGSDASTRAEWEKLVNPQAGLAFAMIGMDPQHRTIAPPPRFDSAEEAGEIVEDYWMALTRDVPFSEYDSHPLTQAAVADINRLSDFRGPTSGGRVTTGTLFRGLTPGDLTGPFISQFLLRPAPLGSQYVDQRMRTVPAGQDFMTTFDEWWAVQNGIIPDLSRGFDAARRYINTGRDLSEWVHVDVLFQAYFNAALILAAPPDVDLQSGGIGAPLNPGNPYLASATQQAFGTFGDPFVKSVLAEVAPSALKAIWCQKWYVHRRLRPEVFAARVHQHIVGAADYPIHNDVFNSSALDEIFNRFGTYLLPQVFPEGSPIHPSYGAGHATVAGACVTILKAMFDENYVIPNPMVPDPSDPTRLIPYDGEALTVGGELNKLASNIALGRDIAGVHWRSDATESLKLGEAIAISVLDDHRLTYNEVFDGFTFTKFDGTTITV